MKDTRYGGNTIHGFIEKRPRPVSEFDFNEVSPAPSAPPLGSSGDGEAIKGVGSEKSTNVSQPDNTAPPSKGPAMWPNQGK